MAPRTTRCRCTLPFMLLAAALQAACGGGAGDRTAELKRQLGALDQPANLVTGGAHALEDSLDGPEYQDLLAAPDEQALDPQGAPVTYRTWFQDYTVSASFDTQVLLNPGTDVIYPGSVLLGHTIDDGSYVEVTTGTKRPITVSYDLTGVVGGVVSGTIVPTLSAFRELHNRILSQTIPPQSSIYSYESTRIRNETDLDIKFSAGAKYSAPGIEASVKSGFDFSSAGRTNKYMIRFMQTFYTVDVNQGAGTFLFEDFDVADFHGYRPVYVASVAYGRLAYLTIESEESWETIKASLDVCVETTSFEGNAAYEMALRTLQERTTFNITVVGGTTVATSVAGFDEFLRAGGFSPTNSGKIISYKLRFVDDNTVANTIFNGSYVVRRTEAVAGRGIRVHLRVPSLFNWTDDGDGDAEFAGLVRFYDTGAATLRYLWAYSEGGYFQCSVDTTCSVGGGWASIDFPLPSDRFTVDVTDFIEVDGGANDTYGYAIITPSVADVLNSTNHMLTITTYYSGGGEYVTFNLETAAEYLY